MTTATALIAWYDWLKHVKTCAVLVSKRTYIIGRDRFNCYSRAFSGEQSQEDEPEKRRGRQRVCIQAGSGRISRSFLSAFLNTSPLQTHILPPCIWYWLVVWNIFYFSIYWMSSSQLTFIFFRGVGQPPTRICIKIYTPNHQITMDVLWPPEVCCAWAGYKRL